MGYYSAIKKNEIMPVAATWMNLEIITVNEVRKKTNTMRYHLYMESKRWHRDFPGDPMVTMGSFHCHDSRFNP